MDKANNTTDLIERAKILNKYVNYDREEYICKKCGYKL